MRGAGKKVVARPFPTLLRCGETPFLFPHNPPSCRARSPNRCGPKNRSCSPLRLRVQGEVARLNHPRWISRLSGPKTVRIPTGLALADTQHLVCSLLALSSRLCEFAGVFLSEES